MSQQHERLVALIDFVEHTAKMQALPPPVVQNQGPFHLFEHEAANQPGIHVNEIRPGEDEDDEIWLEVERLREGRSPELPPKLKPWVAVSHQPERLPTLRPNAKGADLIEAGERRAKYERTPPGQPQLPSMDADAYLELEEFEGVEQVRAMFKGYVSQKWNPWAEAEKPRRKTIALYGKLFVLKQQLEGGIVDAPLEFVFGVGMAIQDKAPNRLNYPLVTRLVELSLDEETGALQIRPRDTDPQLESDWFASVDNPGVSPLEKAFRDFYAQQNTTFSPFDRGTFEAVLKSAATHLASDAVFLPDSAGYDPQNRSLPKSGEILTLTDTWVVFARPRSQNVFLNDLARLRKRVEELEDGELPGAAAAPVTDPPDVALDFELPSFRGVGGGFSGMGDGDGETRAKKVQDLFFPKPYNDEQVRIVQYLEAQDGVVVQGPPGTGKTHTIANIICHYLASGKRVLVTSQKDPALAVLRDQLPEAIRPLAISLLTSEAEGMKQFEFAINRIAAAVTTIDKTAYRRDIAALADKIDGLHRRISELDNETCSWARKNLSSIEIEDERVAPADAARDVVSHDDWRVIPDALTIESIHRPEFNDDDIIQLRQARAALGGDIRYVSTKLPAMTDFPPALKLLEAHKDLSRCQILTSQIDKGDVPALADTSQTTLEAAQQLKADIDALKELREEVIKARKTWTVPLRENLKSGRRADAFRMLDALGAEFQQVRNAEKAFLERPVSTPTGMDADPTLVEQVTARSQGHGAGLFGGLFQAGAVKERMAAVKVLTGPPATPEDWRHVLQFLQLQKRWRELAVRWNALAAECGLEKVGGSEPSHGMEALEHFRTYRKVLSVCRAEAGVTESAKRLFPGWSKCGTVASDAMALAELEVALDHHLMKQRLANVWSVKEDLQRVLQGCQGPVVDDIRAFVESVLGNPAVDDAAMQAAWSRHMAELNRVLGLGVQLHAVARVTELIAASGAPSWAKALREPLTAATDPLLPGNWRTAWRWRRLATELERIDGQAHLKRLSLARHNEAADLARAYEDQVVKLTWLKLAENATGKVTAALQAYLNAIKRIGKGTGKRAVRYRQDAREAANQSNQTVPCWIMPHYRVSESLPPELGCFHLVIIDEASQSDLAALPALLRAEKVLIVGDDKQVSPEGIGLEEEKILSLMNRYLRDQVDTYRAQMSPERSIYDLYKVVFAKSTVMLREHFRCVAPIIEYSKREFYDHELRPLRLPHASQRLDPPLVDVLVEDGLRKGDINRAEAAFIAEEVRRLVDDPRMQGRTIGVVSLLGSDQAAHVYDRLYEELGEKVMVKYAITAGDARTFQGKERHVMFLSMVCSPNDGSASLSREAFRQRFNVAASRARDRMYLVRSVQLEDLRPADELRASLIRHFTAPFQQDERRAEDLRRYCESDFEREVYDLLVERAYHVTPQLPVGGYRIDLVVEGHNDARLAIECDGDRYHGPDKWQDDMARQRVLERAGWQFWRCFASTWVRRREEMLADLIQALTDRGVTPLGAEGAPRSVHTELRRFRASGPREEQLGADPPELEIPPLATQTESASVATPESATEVPPDSPPEEFTLQGGEVEAPARAMTGKRKVFENLDDLLHEYKLKSEDKRKRGGALWVYAEDADPVLSGALHAFGFKYAQSRGWWKS